jgi:hypothetical protein
MKRRNVHGVAVLIVWVSVVFSGSALAGELVAWGFDLDNDINNVPSGTDYVQIAVGDSHGVALTSGGIVKAWGRNREGQCNVPDGTYKAIGAGGYFSLAVRTDGSIVAWGEDKAGQVSNTPGGKGFTAVDGGLLFGVALRSDGSIVAWGNDTKGEVSGVPSGGSFTAIAAGDYHAVALRSDGSIVTWGNLAAMTGMPASAGFRKIDAGGNHCVAIASDGSIVFWGSCSPSTDLAGVPDGNDYVGVATGVFHALAVRSDGSIAGWGAGPVVGTYPNLGQASPLLRNDYTAAAGGLYFSVALVDGNASIFADNFNDWSIASIWRLKGDDLTQCWMDEVNQRLEFRATALSERFSVRYISNGWHVDPANDFQMKTDFHYDLSLGNAGALAVVLEPNTPASANQHLEFGVGATTSATYFWYSVEDGNAVSTKQNARAVADGVLYLSYDKAADELYLSDVGYGSAHAWATIKGFLGGRWRVHPISVSLMGQSDRLAIASGQAFFDNFSFEAIVPAAVNQPSDVYRFWAPATGCHFYTTSESEKTKLIEKYPSVWVYEGVAFTAASAQFNSSLVPVYRFWSSAIGCHFYTVSESEKAAFQSQTQAWRFEGTVFYAYPEGKQPANSKPIYRFVRKSDGTYFYTASESERDKLVNTLSHIYTAEGVAFYTYEL